MVEMFLRHLLSSLFYRNDFNMAVLKAFVNLHEFSDMILVQALRSVYYRTVFDYGSGVFLGLMISQSVSSLGMCCV